VVQPEGFLSLSELTLLEAAQLAADTRAIAEQTSGAQIQ